MLNLLQPKQKNVINPAYEPNDYKEEKNELMSWFKKLLSRKREGNTTLTRFATICVKFILYDL